MKTLERPAPRPALHSRLVDWAIARAPDAWAVRLLHRRTLKEWPRLNPPRTFNEKVAWRKLHQRDPRFVAWADKIEAKRLAAALLGEQHVIPSLWEGERPEDIPFGELPPPWIAKSSNGFGSHVIVRQGSDLDPPAAVARLRRALEQNPTLMKREWAYEGIAPRVLVERLLPADGELLPRDYKFYTFDGRATFIELDMGRGVGQRRNVYDRDWRLQPFTMRQPNSDAPVPRPDRLPLMIELAERAGALFDFVRVDFYDTSEGVFFGEATFYPAAGLMPYRPRSWDRLMGDCWRLDTDRRRP